MSQSKKLQQCVLQQQGLATRSSFGKGLSGTLAAIEHLGYVQIDTISVIERAHHHILWSRVGDYKPQYLNQLVADKQIFEYWFHAASYLPMRDYRFALPQMLSVKNDQSRYHQNVDKSLMQEVLARFQDEGPLRARDFDKDLAGSKQSQGGWWNWGPAKRAIERLYMQGDIMICKRNGMEKIYDVANKCLPHNIDLRIPSLEEYAQYLFDSVRRAQGVFTFKQLIHLKTGKPIRQAMQDIVDNHIASGQIVAFDTGGNEILDSTNAAYFADTNLLNTNTRTRGDVCIVSPFDNSVIHRDRLAGLFNFDYTIECYVPAAKRQYGYFTLPLLYQGKFVGRIDCKAHRREKRFELISFYVESNFAPNEVFMQKLHKSLNQFAGFNGCNALDISILN